jgi:uroporphyrinogen decarboxylase
MKNKTLSARENYLRAAEFRHPEWIPISYYFLPSVWMKYREALEEVVLRHPLVFEGYVKPMVGFDEAPLLHRANEHYTDAWGCVWYGAQAGIMGQVVGHPLADWNAFETFRAPDPLKTADWETVRRDTEEARRKGLLTTGGLVTFVEGGFFDRLQFLRGLENLLVDFMTDPPELHRLIEIVLDYNMTCIRKWLEIGVDVMYFHGDLATQRGLMLSPATFRKYLKPAYEKMFKACRSGGAHVYYSTDGRSLDILDDLIECGITLHDPQVSANTLDGIAAAYKGRLCAIVDIDEQMLPFCRPEEIWEQIREIVKRLGAPEGGLMLFACPSQDVPLRNIEAICDAWEDLCYRNWPRTGP